MKHVISGGGSWDGKGDPPKMTTCQPAIHIDFDAVNEHQKVSTGPLVFTYGVEWRESEVRSLVCLFSNPNKVVNCNNPLTLMWCGRFAGRLGGTFICP